MSKNLRLLVPIVLVALAPASAVASLITFEFTGQTDPMIPVTGVLTVDTVATGQAVPGYANAVGYDVVQPGTGLSIAFDGSTYFANSLTVFVAANQPSGQCGPPPFCDFISLISDIARIYFQSSGPALGRGLSAPTLDAFATESLQDFHATSLGESVVLDLPDQRQILGHTQSIMRVGEPTTLALFSLALACLGFVVRRKA